MNLQSAITGDWKFQISVVCCCAAKWNFFFSLSLSRTVCFDVFQIFECLSRLFSSLSAVFVFKWKSFIHFCFAIGSRSPDQHGSERLEFLNIISFSGGERLLAEDTGRWVQSCRTFWIQICTDCNPI